jgi:HNH endonuclease
MPNKNNAPTHLDKLRALIIQQTDNCVLFTGSLNNGYGHLRVRGKVRQAHRVAWELANGADVPAGMFILHSCLKTRACVNPRHLRVGTAQDNADDMMRDGTQVSVRGDAHYARLHPELMPRGEAHPARLHPERMARGEAHGLAVLTADKVRAVRESLGRGETGAAIARALGVSETAIRNIKLGHTWKHVV